MNIFVPLVGQHENIGDVVLRRELVEWLAPEGRMHVYAGSSTDSYDEALELPRDAVVYRSISAWASALTRELIRSSEVAYVYKPGEIQLTVRGLKEHIGLLPLVAVTRMRGGVVLRIGAGARNFGAFPAIVVRSMARLAQFTAWRDTRTTEALGGLLMPDLGFGQIGRSRESGTPRTRLTVTMRGDRATPSPVWRTAVRMAAEGLGLKLTVITQVERDETLSQELADEWGCDYIPWLSRNHASQEAELRRIFRESELVVSDRLHALIIAVTEGAAVASVADSPSDKVQRHFDAAGIPIEIFDSAAQSADDILAGLSRATASGPAQQLGLSAALQRLRDMREAVVSAIRG